MATDGAGSAQEGTPIVTMGLAFGAYARRESWRRMLLHSWRLDGADWTPLCGRVALDSYVLNLSPADDAAKPTCETCRRRDPRFATVPAELR